MNPIRPGTNEYPTSQALNIGLATADNKRRWQRAAKRINDVVRKWSYDKVSVSKDEAPKVRKQDKRTSTLTNAYRYDYQVDSRMMDLTMVAVENILNEDLLNGSDFWTTRFWLNPYIDESVIDGTTDSLESAIRITEGAEVAPHIATLTAQQQLSTPAYMDRLRMVHGRVFESMQGLTGEMKSQLRLTLTEGVARGIGIRDLTGMINKRLSVGMSRAKRIARTEINNTYRSAYMSEAKELNETALAEDKYMIMQCHRSALSPTTRPNHASRHGNVYTMQQQQDWWASGSESINCLCATLDVLVNKKTGEILQSKMVERMKKQKGEWWPV